MPTKIGNNSIKNPIDLLELKSERFSDDSEYNMVLKEDVWKQGILILRSGKYLTGEIIDKLINFGIREVNVHLDDNEFQEDENQAIEELKRNYIKSQNILIIDSKYKNIIFLASILTKMGFREKYFCCHQC